MLMRRARGSAPLGVLAVLLAVGGGAVALWSRQRPGQRTGSAIRHRSRTARNAELARLGATVGAAYASTAARGLFASAERRIELDRERELKTAEAVAERLGNMKGALMKLGQMASYLDEGLPEPMRLALAQLQANAPPMSGELASQVIERELGARPEQLFVEWDPVPIAAASIGQVHRAVVLDPVTKTERAVAVKVQYPGVHEAIQADLATSDLLGTVLKQGFGGLDPAEMVAEIRDRLTEELDYEIEARNQRAFADYYRGHPFIHVPDVVDAFSTTRVLTSDLVAGAAWDEVLTWDQHERNLAAECIYRFVFRSLYRFRAFNGDPHPGNYLFHGGGRVTFLDFGLVKHFSAAEIDTFERMIGSAVIDPDPARYRSIVEEAGMLRPGAPVDTEEAGAYFTRFYEPVRTNRTMTWSPDYSSAIVRHTFDRTSPIAQYATVPKAFVFIQRINLGLYALLGHLRATGNYRMISEEIWPRVSAPPSTPMGVDEAAWLAAHHPTTAA
jgi:predicted unusual protein kinase regulating ubiquinone biosynthesis (AarF/ABC1/UbiB family)